MEFNRLRGFQGSIQLPTGWLIQTQLWQSEQAGKGRQAFQSLNDSNVIDLSQMTRAIKDHGKLVRWHPPCLKSPTTRNKINKEIPGKAPKAAFLVNW